MTESSAPYGDSPGSCPHEIEIPLDLYDLITTYAASHGVGFDEVIITAVRELIAHD